MELDRISDIASSNRDETRAQAPAIVHVGIDVGSTTTKYVVIDPASTAILDSSYERHHAHQAQSVAKALEAIAQRFPASRIRLAVCGSGGEAAAQALGAAFIQEVVANSLAVRALHPRARCAIELGGQDAKMVFFRENDSTKTLDVSDMRMNGSCAGGTGAFIDEIATLLKVPVERFDELAAQGATLYDISGRCGVYAKTDIQPLLNQGVAKEDIALSSFHAIAKQTIGGLAQGLDIEAPVIFEGGPLTFNPTLVRVFAERLCLRDEDVIRPDHPETIVAFGTALSLSGMFSETPAFVDPQTARQALEAFEPERGGGDTQPFFASDEERADFFARHPKFSITPAWQRVQLKDGRETAEPRTVRAYLGIDSGSTTTKFALLDENEELIDSFYAPNQGEPLDVAKNALIALRDRYRSRGLELEIVACGTTGYGEMLFAAALHADCHMVETVAHAAAATKYEPGVSFILDIGGQDMKAIWVDDGIVSDIVVNEACSSGCGSFLENFGSTLGIATEDIAEAAFRSDSPAALGSRCTVFMNSSIVTEQRNGKTSDDIMAGLCRSIIENVFTKVIRISNLSRLGDYVVVQGGTFENDAVLRALEQYLGKHVTRAPFPGLMGAIGAALLTMRHVRDLESDAPGTFASSCIGLDELDGFSYEQTSGLTCPFCSNHCSRTRIAFSDGSSFVTGNRCPRGEVVGDPSDAEVRKLATQALKRHASAENLFDTRRSLLLREAPVTPLAPSRNITIGIPLVLAFWDTLPFWSAFWRSLGFDVRVSKESTRQTFERGLSAVTSDTVCFPAKLVHGHVRALAEAKVDRIFMPIITTVPPENAAKTSESMCAVVKGYPMVIRNSDNPAKRFGVAFDDPLFHWYGESDRKRQLSAWMEEQFGIEASLCHAAIEQGDAAQRAFREALLAQGARVLDEARERGTYAVVLASRPYHNDDLVNHELPGMFAALGVPVMPPDAVPGATEVDLSNSRLDIVNNFHARMLSTAVLAAQRDHMEYAQIVSFGCGHDAYLSDEIVRMMKEISGKTPLIMKVDESDIEGPLRIRVRSFIETVNMRRAREAACAASEKPAAHTFRTLSDPYPQKFEKEDRAKRVVLIPNTSHAFCRLMSTVFSKQGLRAEPLDVGREEAIRLGKKYVHNDICFPAQIVIGEALAALESGKYDGMDVAVATGKYIGDCRLTHYAALLRKALNDSGFGDVPIITNDDVDAHRIHPGFKMNAISAIRVAMALPMIDALEELLRKIRPYELVEGAADNAFERALDALLDGLARGGVRGMKKGFEKSIRIMDGIEYDRSHPRPTVLIVGEYLLNFHPGANHDVEAYLERNGLEVIEARMTDVIRKTYFYKDAQVKEFHVEKPLQEKAWYAIANKAFDIAHDVCDRIAQRHPLYTRACRMNELVVASDPIMHHTFDAGEGVLIPGEILHHASQGCRAFVILQPFGCLPNHVCGRGVAKRLKELYPDAQILPLDYDPDVSFANVENRLQMLIMNARAHDSAHDEATVAAGGQGASDRDASDWDASDRAGG